MDPPATQVSRDHRRHERQGAKDATYASREKALPAIAATVAGHEFKVVAGKSAAIKLNVNGLNGHVAGLVAIATDLPPNLSASSAAISDKGGEVTITLSATTEAKAASVPIRLMVLGPTLTILSPCPPPMTWPKKPRSN